MPIEQCARQRHVVLERRLPCLGTGFVLRVLADLAAAGTHSMVSLQVMGSQDVRSQALRDEVELGIAAQDMSTAGVEHALCAHYVGVVALPAGRALARSSVVTPKQLARHPFVALDPDDAVSQRLDAILRAHGVQLQTVVETSPSACANWRATALASPSSIQSRRSTTSMPAWYSVRSRSGSNSRR